MNDGDEARDAEGEAGPDGVDRPVRPSVREQRLAEQLRANLKRRKAQKRSRDAVTVPDGEEKPS